MLRDRSSILLINVFSSLPSPFQVTAAIAKFEHRDVRIYSGAPMTTVCSVDNAGPLNDG